MLPPAAEAPGQPGVRIAGSSATITVIGEARADVVTDGGAGLGRTEDGCVEVHLERSSRSVTVRCPEGSDLVVGTRSGSVHLRGYLGAVRATTVSGSIKAEHVRSADLRAMSGSVTVGVCDATCRVSTKSGSARVGSAGAVEVTIGSGSVEVDHVGGPVRIRAISGTVRVGAGGHDRIEVETMSGSITVTVPTGCHPDVRARSMSSRPRIETPAGHDCEVIVRTLSGGIVVRSA